MLELNKGKEVMEYLRPNGGWVIYGEDFDSIQYLGDCEPISKKLFNDTLAEIENIVQAKQLAIESNKNAILDRLGISADEAKLIIS
jgi:hypothetical protein